MHAVCKIIQLSVKCCLYIAFKRFTDNKKQRKWKEWNRKCAEFSDVSKSGKKYDKTCQWVSHDPLLIKNCSFPQHLIDEKLTQHNVFLTIRKCDFMFTKAF